MREERWGEVKMRAYSRKPIAMVNVIDRTEPKARHFPYNIQHCVFGGSGVSFSSAANAAAMNRNIHIRPGCFSRLDYHPQHH